VVVDVLVGAHETKVRPAVVIASATYLAERPDSNAFKTQLTTGSASSPTAEYAQDGDKPAKCFP